jgi:hypothetical protein
VNTNFADSLHCRALQIGANGQRAAVELLKFSEGRLKIKLTDVTDNQSPNPRVAGDLTNDRRWGVKRSTCTCANHEMHDQDIRSLRELDEPWIGTCLIGAEYDRHIARLHAVRQSREMPVWYSQRGHDHSLLVEDCLRLRNPADRDRGIRSNVITGSNPSWSPVPASWSVIPGMVIADSDIVIADSGIMIADSGVIAWTPGRPPHR